MVLLVPDDMPAGATTLAGNVDEMRALYKDWDSRRVPFLPCLPSDAFYLLTSYFHPNKDSIQTTIIDPNTDNDIRIPKLLSMCESVSKWKLQIRLGMDSWSHPSGSFTMLGDAVHATLPYLASGYRPLSPPLLKPLRNTNTLSAQACPSKTQLYSAKFSLASLHAVSPRNKLSTSKSTPFPSTRNAAHHAHAW